MSMYKNGSITPSTTATIEARRACWASALARYTRNRREQLGLTVDSAAELSGMKVSQWCALEDGWTPSALTVTWAIATTLQVRRSDYDLLAFLSRSAQENG
jgi:hypothetical protein